MDLQKPIKEINARCCATVGIPRIAVSDGRIQIRWDNSSVIKLMAKVLFDPGRR